MTSSSIRLTDLSLSGQFVPRQICDGMQASPPIDLEARGYERGYSDGLEEGIAQARADHDALVGEKSKLEVSFRRLDDELTAQLQDRILQVVMVLCEDLIETTSSQPEMIAARVEKAVGLLRRQEDEREVCLHPDDIELVRKSIGPDLKLKSDASLPRGHLRIDTPDGGIEDGPHLWRQKLIEALQSQA
ncbi:FliH/SctL family protein [Sphingomicrobium astaxanthinifaciens]|nr:FliH/SctL family protein [Sphingomicrobium astaxanthinifaciens]MCJ7420365.1 hypothetical protein [Sphingomicrobium astaxanthinifaciens]